MWKRREIPGKPKEKIGCEVIYGKILFKQNGN